MHLPELHIVKRNDGDELATDALSVVGSVPPSPSPLPSPTQTRPRLAQDGL